MKIKSYYLCCKNNNIFRNQIEARTLYKKDIIVYFLILSIETILKIIMKICVFYYFGGSKTLLKTPSPGPGIDPQGPGTRSPNKKNKK